MLQPNFNHGVVSTLLARAREEGRSAEVILRLEWITYFLEHSSSLTETCEHFNIKPSTLRRWMKRFDPANLSTLEEKSRTPHKLRTSNVSNDVVQFIREYREKSPLIGKERIAQLLFEERGIVLSPSTIGRVIEREKFYFASTPLHWQKRLGERKPDAPKVVTEAITPELPVAHTLPVTTCTCTVCRLSRYDWKRVKASALGALFVVNIAWILLLAATVWSEHQRGVEMQLHASAAEETTDTPRIEPNVNGPLSDSHP